ncbi:prevent-host-death family protein [Methylobacterium sp. RAS18]|nr:prevent-host-death family protein [Methylobacterium sp. RAS18]
MSDIDYVLGRNDPDILSRHKNISAKDARNNFSEIMNATKFGNERFVITHRGKPTMALVTINDLRLLEQISESADLFLKEKATDNSQPVEQPAESEFHEQHHIARISKT